MADNEQNETVVVADQKVVADQQVEDHPRQSQLSFKKDDLKPIVEQMLEQQKLLLKDFEELKLKNETVSTEFSSYKRSAEELKLLQQIPESHHERAKALMKDLDIEKAKDVVTALADTIKEYTKKPEPTFGNVRFNTSEKKSTSDQAKDATISDSYRQAVINSKNAEDFIRSNLFNVK